MSASEPAFQPRPQRLSNAPKPPFRRELGALKVPPAQGHPGFVIQTAFVNLLHLSNAFLPGRSRIR
jgi:hypothetical protein